MGATQFLLSPYLEIDLVCHFSFSLRDHWCFSF